MPLDPSVLRPSVDGQAFVEARRKVRRDAGALAAATLAPVVPSNLEELEFDPNPVSSFTKGLPHDRYGRVDPDAYGRFVKALRAPAALSSSGGLPAPLGPRDQVDSHLPQAPAPYLPWASGTVQRVDQVHRFHSDVIEAPGEEAQAPSIRRWTSPQAGLVFDLTGPAAAGVALPPAPKLGSHELTGEMAELYAMALLRDVPFAALERPQTIVRVDNGPTLTVGEVVDQLNALPWFDPRLGEEDVNAGCGRRRRRSRQGGSVRALAPRDLFRGLTEGSRFGPTISQFMLVGTQGREEGRVAFGAQELDQRCQCRAEGVDYLTTWSKWLDVQNGACHRGARDARLRRFATTPRDLASYVEHDLPFQCFLIATLVLLDRGLPFDPGLPDSGRPTREGGVVWGAPHLISLLSEVASRAATAVWRTKFQIHRRARPEAIAARLALATGGDAVIGLGAAHDPMRRMLRELYGRAPDLMHWVERLNARQALRDSIDRGLVPAGHPLVTPEIGRNIMLPMAYPSGSPMTPAYGSGHAAAAGACATIMKAFFALFATECEASPPVRMDQIGLGGHKVGAADHLSQSGQAADGLAVQGEIDKLASNVAAGRLIAGVNCYSDCYEGIRLGERVALGVLREQMMISPEPVSMRFDDVDGRRITLSFDPATECVPSLTVRGMSMEDWWLEAIAHHIPSAGFARAAE